jgi:hypothetical protein
MGVVVLPVLAGIGTIYLLLRTDIPLGLTGEWVWNRTPAWPPITHFLLPSLAFILCLLIILWGKHRLIVGGEWQAVWLLPLLLTVGGVFQWTVFDVPDPPLGIERWPLSIYYPASSGYFTMARKLDSSADFARNYHEWIQDQDNFHIGTHPPGLILAYRVVLDAFAKDPQLANVVLDNLPTRLADGISTFDDDRALGTSGRATIATAAVGTWLIYLLTMIPIYGMARLGAPPSTSWVAASGWMLPPAGLLFVPVSDCLFPLLATMIVWLMLHRPTSKFPLLAIPAGALLGLGLCFSLAFLTILPIACATRYLAAREQSPGGGARSLIGVGLFVGTLGVLVLAAALLDVHLVPIWRTNLSKHAGFYEQMPRSYWPWLGLNLIEFGISTSPVLFVLSLIGIAVKNPLAAPADKRLRWLGVVWLATLALLDLSGRNLSEVGRLWMLLIPFGLVLIARLGETRLTNRRILVLWSVAAVVAMLLVGQIEPLLPVLPAGD